MKQQVGPKLAMKTVIHCGLCLSELPEGKSPSEYAQLEVGFTKAGLQIWCRRHECNVFHIDFQGQQHPACTTRLPRPTGEDGMAV